MPFNIVLYEPEIPPNTGNVMRLAANTGAALHLVEPLGFELDEPRLRRAGLDYREFADVRTYASLADALAALGEPRVFALSTRGVTRYDAPHYRAGDAFLMGPETRGLPQALLDSLPEEQRLRLPMRPGNRSLNLSNAAAVVVYEAWRQLGFDQNDVPFGGQWGLVFAFDGWKLIGQSVFQMRDLRLQLLPSLAHFRRGQNQIGFVRIIQQRHEAVQRERGTLVERAEDLVQTVVEIEDQ